MLVAYILADDFMGQQAGDVVQLDPEDPKTQALVDAGVINEASEEDVQGDEGPDDGAGEMPAPDAMARAVADLTTKLENRIAKATELAINKVNKQKPRLTLPAEAKDKTGGFKNFGDFMRCMAFAHHGDWNAQRKMTQFRTKASPTGANEGTNSAGGYAVLPEWTDEIWDKARNYPNLLEKVQKYSISGQTLNVPAINETSRADGSRFGGLQSYYIAEGDTFTGSQLGLTQVSLTLHKLGVFCYLTNELINDNAFDLTNYLQEKVALELLFKTNDGLINGAGSTQPTGIMNAAALVTVSTSSSNATIAFPDLVAMYQRLYFGSRASAVWLINQEVLPQLLQMTFPNTSGTFSAFGGVTFSAHDEFPLRIFGKPVIEVENCSALGNSGDIILCDLSQYNVIDKGLEVAVSDQFHFNQYETVYRFVYRWDAKSPWTSALSPYKGSKTYSPFIVLAGRGT